MARVTFDKKIKKYTCFTTEQQQAFERLSPRHRAYVELRGNKGYKKTDAYKALGLKASTASQGAYMLERTKPIIAELIAALQGQAQLRGLSQADSQVNKDIDALAMKESSHALAEIIESGDVEKAKSIQFYRDIVNGKIKTVRVTKRYNGKNDLLEKKVEEISDIDAKMKAQKELDRILHINEMVDVGQLHIGDMTINIVDSAKHEELEDSRNTIKLDPDDVQIIDGEQAIVVEEKEEHEKPKPTVETTVEKQ